MFYEVREQVAQTMQEKMAALSYDKGYADAETGIAAQFASNSDYMRGFRDGTPLHQEGKSK